MLDSVTPPGKLLGAIPGSGSLQLGRFPDLPVYLFQPLPHSQCPPGSPTETKPNERKKKHVYANSSSSMKFKLYLKEKILQFDAGCAEMGLEIQGNVKGTE